MLSRTFMDTISSRNCSIAVCSSSGHSSVANCIARRGTIVMPAGNPYVKTGFLTPITFKIFRYFIISFFHNFRYFYYFIIIVFLIFVFLQSYCFELNISIFLHFLLVLKFFFLMSHLFLFLFSGGLFNLLGGPRLRFYFLCNFSLLFFLFYFSF